MEFIGDMFIGTGTLKDGATRYGELITVDTGPTVRRWDLEKMSPVGTSATTMTGPIGISLCTDASAVILSGSTARVDVVELNSGYVRQLTTGAIASTTNTSSKGQQIACDWQSKICLACSNNVAGNVFKIGMDSGSLSNGSVSGISGKVTSVICIQGSGDFLLGTDDGKIHQCNNTPTVLRTVSLPTTPNTGSAPVLKVSGISFYNDRLIAMTAQGVYYVYKWSTGEVLDRGVVGVVSATIGTALCDASSGLIVFGPNYNKSQNNHAILEYDLASTQFFDTYVHEQTSTPHVSSGVDIKTWRAWLIVGNTRIRVMQCSARHTRNVETRAQDPSPTDVAVRIIRIRTPKAGQSRVVLDQNISAAATNLTAIDESEYIEIAIRSGSPNKWDIRRFNT